MRLRETIISAKSGLIFEKEFNLESYCISELYCSQLKEYAVGGVKKCIVSLNTDWGEELLQYTDWSDVLKVNLNFDFASYFSLQDNKEKKRMQLEALHKGMMLIAKKQTWETDPLLDAYNGCLEKNLEYKFFAKEKAKASPNRKLKFNIWCDWGLDYFKAYWVLFDKNMEELDRGLLTELKTYDAELFYYIKFKWLNNQEVLIEDKYKYGKDLEWTVSFEDERVE